ncbi:MAG: hypothetical protein CML93_03170 [Rhodobiaceae bacterium]|nr:hypothetical protein [Rhodobiaceae bacterium]
MIKEYLHVKDKYAWEKFLKKFDNISIYQSLEWFNILKNSFGLSGNHLVSKNNEDINGCLPLMLIKNMILGKKLISMPHGSSGGGVITKEKIIESDLIDKAINIIKEKNIGYLEIRSDIPKTIYKEKGFIHTNPFVKHILSLEDEDTNWKNVSRGHKSSINKSNGIEIKELADTNELKIWFQIYQTSNRDFGTPAYGLNMFNHIYNELFNRKMAKILLCIFGGKIIGGILLLSFGDTVIYRLGAVDSDYLKYRPFNKLLWAGIKDSIRNNYSYFDMGTSAIDNFGLIDFKNRFGSDSFPVNFYYFINNKSIPQMENYLSKDSISKKIWKKLPVFLTKKLSVPIRKWIC